MPTITVEERLLRLQEFAKSLDPSAKILFKNNSPFMKFLNFFVRIFNKRFMDSFATTIVNRVYIPREWFGEHRDLNTLIVHEVGGHVRLTRWFGLGISPWIGFLPYAICYGILLFPLFFAYFRYRIELFCDSVAWKWMLENKYDTFLVRDRAKHFGQTVGSWDYLYPLPKFWVIWGFNHKVEKIILKHQKRA